MLKEASLLLIFLILQALGQNVPYTHDYYLYHNSFKYYRAFNVDKSLNGIPLKLVLNFTDSLASAHVEYFQTDNVENGVNSLTNNAFVSEGSREFTLPEGNTPYSLTFYLQSTSSAQIECLFEIQDALNDTVYMRESFTDYSYSIKSLWIDIPIKVDDACQIKITLYGHAYDILSISSQSLNDTSSNAIKNLQLQSDSFIIRIYSSLSNLPMFGSMKLTVETDSESICIHKCFGEDNLPCYTGVYQDTCVVNPLAPLACSFNCAEDVGSTGYFLEKVQECQCRPDFYWNSIQLQCLPNCYQKLSSGPQTDDGTLLDQCICREPAKWNLQALQCRLNCTAISYSTGQQQSPQVCQCQPESNWNPGTLQCQLNCSRISFAQAGKPAIVTDSDQMCECQEDFEWKDKKCVRICDSPNEGEPTPYGRCECVGNSKWDQTLGICKSIDCASIKFTVKGSQLTDQGCECNPGYKWDPQTFDCIIEQCDMEADPNLESETPIDAYHCQCKTGFVWSYNDGKCLRSCQLDMNSTGSLRSPDIDECVCLGGYYWNNQAKKCLLFCGNKVGEKAEEDADVERCLCEEGFMHNVEDICVRDCDLIDNSAGPSQLGNDFCECDQNYDFVKTDDSLEAECKLDCSDKVNIFNDGYQNDNQKKCACKAGTRFDNSLKLCTPVCTSDPLSTDRKTSNICECKENAEFNFQTAKCECKDGFSAEDFGKQQICRVPQSASIPIGITGGAIGSAGMITGIILYRKKKLRQQQQEKENEVVVSVENKIESQENMAEKNM